MNIRIFGLGCVGEMTAGCLASQGHVVVAAQKCAPFAEPRQVVTARHPVVDTNGWPELRELPARYEGFCW
jgi:hypothetical protein